MKHEMVSKPRGGLFVDGDNISAKRAGEILTIAKSLARLDVARAYGDTTKIHAWQSISSIRVVDTCIGQRIDNGDLKNRYATDTMMTAEAVRFAMSGGVEVIIIATKDGDFAPLVQVLREIGCQVYGIGCDAAAEVFQEACTKYFDLPKAGIKLAKV